MCSCTEHTAKKGQQRRRQRTAKATKTPGSCTLTNTQNLQLKRDPGVPIPLYQQPGALGVVLVSLHHALLVEEPPDFNLDFNLGPRLKSGGSSSWPLRSS